MVRTLRCGRSNPGSNPGHGMSFIFSSLSKFKSILIVVTFSVLHFHVFFTVLSVQPFANEVLPSYKSYPIIRLISALIRRIDISTIFQLKGDYCASLRTFLFHPTIFILTQILPIEALTPLLVVLKTNSFEFEVTELM